MKTFELEENYDFERIPPSGGILTIRALGNGFQHSFEHKRAVKVAAHMQRISFNGIDIDIPLGSDEEGFFGHQCFECKKYFRTDFVSGVNYCPYCLFGPANSDAFRTETQKKFMELVAANILSALREQKDKTLDLDQLATTVDKAERKLLETERQQVEVICDESSCGSKYDIMGTFGRCPRCAKRNNLQHLKSQYALLIERLDNPRYTKTQRAERGNEWRDIVKTCVSEYESLCNDFRSFLLSIPSTPKRRKQISEMSFQSVIESAVELDKCLAFNMFKGIKDGDRTQITRMVQARHLLEHRGGTVDDEYIQKSGDTSLKLGQRIRIDSNEARRLVVLLEQLASNFSDDYHSIS